MNIRQEDAVSPVIGVMLMIAVTIIIAAVVSGFAGGYSDEDRKAPTATISCQVTDAGLLFTHESGEFIDLADVIVVLRNGEDTTTFYGSEHSDMAKVSETDWGTIQRTDKQIDPGNQFFLPADNNGSAVAGGYLGWDSPEFCLTIDEIGVYRIIDRVSGQTISEGMINI